MESSNLVIPANWTFRNSSVAENFESHVREQLPWYDLVAGAVAHIVRHYVPEGGTLYDIGASTGNITKLLEETLKLRNVRTVSIDNSEEMAELFSGYGELVVADAGLYEYDNFDVAVLFLTLMFLTIEKRRELIDRLRRNLRPGGVIVIVDKVEASGGYLSTVMARLTIAGKIATGTDPREVVQKELSLIGVQRPLGSSDIPKDAVNFFRFGEFAGWAITVQE